MTAITGPRQMKEKIPSGYRKGQLQEFTPEMMELFNTLFGYLSPESYLGKLAGGDEAAFEAIEAPQKRQFSDVLSGIGSRYSGMGMGAQKSSGFQNETTSAAQNFAQQLGAQRHGLKTDAIKDLMSLAQMVLGQRPYENFLVKKEHQGAGGWGGVAGSALGAAGGFLGGGPTGALAGANLGYKIGSGFD